MLFESVYGLKTFYDRYELSLAANLSIPALISDLHKIPEALNLLFSLDLDIEGAVPIHCSESLFSRE